MQTEALSGMIFVVTQKQSCVVWAKPYAMFTFYRMAFCAATSSTGIVSGVANENIVQNYLNVALLNVF